jgi:hypothetical protein
MTDQVNGSIPNTFELRTIEKLIDRIKRVTRDTMPEAVIVAGILDVKTGAIATLINGDEQHILGVTKALQMIIPMEVQRDKVENDVPTVN